MVGDFPKKNHPFKDTDSPLPKYVLVVFLIGVDHRSVI